MRGYGKYGRGAKSLSLAEALYGPAAATKESAPCSRSRRNRLDAKRPLLMARRIFGWSCVPPWNISTACRASTTRAFGLGRTSMKRCVWWVT